MKKSIYLILLSFMAGLVLGCGWNASAQTSDEDACQQDCYNPKYRQGLLMMNNKQYEKAKQYFLEAIECPDCPDDNDATPKYRRCVQILNAIKNGEPIPTETNEVPTTMKEEAQTSNIYVSSTPLQLGGNSNRTTVVSVDPSVSNPTTTTTTTTTTVAAAGPTTTTVAAAGPATTTVAAPPATTTVPVETTPPSNTNVTIQNNVTVPVQTTPIQVTPTGNVATTPNPSSTAFSVNGKSEIFRRYTHNGGSDVFQIANASNWEVNKLPSWIILRERTANTFSIICNFNTGEPREATFVVGSGGKEIPIMVRQASSAPTPMLSRSWEKALQSACAQMTDYGRTGDYKGETKVNDEHSNLLDKHGMGLFAWKDGTYYLGNYVNNVINGLGMYLIPAGYEDSNAPGAMYVVGQRKDRLKDGQVNCYDRYGNLIYSGAFQNDLPLAEYPINSFADNMRFDTLQYQGGEVYFGETRDGVPHGFGAFLWTDGSLWMGSWEAGARKGKGILLRADASLQSGTWNGDDFVAN